MANQAHFEWRLSGGASNTDPTASIGGAISNTSVLSQTITASTIQAVTYDDATGNPEISAGNMTRAATNVIRWATSGSNYGADVNIAADGKYTVFAADGIGCVKITKSGTLGGNVTQSNIAVANRTQLLFDNVSAANSADGEAEYRCIFVKNNHASDTMTLVSVWVQSNSNPAEVFTLGLDPAGKNGTPAVISGSTTPPAGVTFVSYPGIADALSIGTLAAGDYYPVWVKRQIIADAGATITASTLLLGAKFI